jgi:FAD/FMN-containing dehydrogenase
MTGALAEEWRSLGVTTTRTLDGDRAGALWRDLAEFPALDGSPLVLKASVLPSRVIDFVAQVQAIDPQASIQAHAGSGIVIARFARFEPADVSRVLVGRLQPAAVLGGGHALVLSSTLDGLTRQAVWGGASGDWRWMEKVKAQFDPKGLLNPGRFIFAGG